MGKDADVRYRRHVSRVFVISLFLSGACGAGTHGSGAEFQFFGSRHEAVEVEATDSPAEWSECSVDDDCVVVPAACCCDGLHWSAVNRQGYAEQRESVCGAEPACDNRCVDAPSARCTNHRCSVGEGAFAPVGD